jgi:hypothetical protein
VKPLVLRSLFSSLEGEEVKFQLKQGFEKIEDIRGIKTRERMVSQNTLHKIFALHPDQI